MIKAVRHVEVLIVGQAHIAVEEVLDAAHRDSCRVRVELHAVFVRGPQRRCKRRVATVAARVKDEGMAALSGVPSHKLVRWRRVQPLSDALKLVSLKEDGVRWRESEVR